MPTLAQNVALCLVISFFMQNPAIRFFPTDKIEAKSLYLTEIPLSGAIEADASLCMGVGELILLNAKRLGPAKGAG